MCALWTGQINWSFAWNRSLWRVFADCWLQLRETPTILSKCTYPPEKDFPSRAVLYFEFFFNLSTAVDSVGWTSIFNECFNYSPQKIISNQLLLGRWYYRDIKRTISKVCWPVGGWWPKLNLNVSGCRPHTQQTLLLENNYFVCCKHKQPGKGPHKDDSRFHAWWISI